MTSTPTFENTYFSFKALTNVDLDAIERAGFDIWNLLNCFEEGLMDKVIDELSWERKPRKICSTKRRRLHIGCEFLQ